MKRSCVVVGAGPAGLAAAHRLAAAGVHVTVLEGANAIGGRTRSERVGDVVVNTGANFVASFYDATRKLLSELGIVTSVPHWHGGVVATPHGKLHLDLSSPRRILQFPLVKLSGKVRAAVQLALAALRRRVHIAKPKRLARLDRGETVEEWGRRAIGDTAYHYLLRAGVEPFFGVGAEQTSAAVGKALVRHALDWHLLFLPAGMGALCDALAAGLEVRTGCPASGIELHKHSVVIRHAGGAVEADDAILAAPASAVAALDGALAEMDRADAASVQYLPSLALYFGYERPITVQYPSVTPAGPGPHPLTNVRTWSTLAPGCVPKGKELVGIHAMGWRSAELLDRDSSAIVAALRADAEEIFGRLADPDWIRLYARVDGIVVPQPGHYRRMAAFLRRPRARLFYAGDWLSGPTIEGAVQTGLSAAERVLKSS
ncbi:MAG: FAD-dependent oxidoreductase [Candidatus Binatia bacterium]